MRVTPVVDWRCVVLIGVVLGLASCKETSPTDPGPMPAGRVVYTALGASDAVGIGAFPISEGYVFLLRGQMLTVKAEVELHNLGINGARMEAFLAEELAPAIASDPDVVTLWVGSNDVIGGRDPKDFRAGLDTILSELRARTSAQVFVGDLADLSKAPLYRTFPDPDVTTARVDAFNAEIRASVAAHGAFLVPIATQLPLDDATFSIDGFHPSNRGHVLLCELFWAEIKTRLR